MKYISSYKSKLGELVLVANDLELELVYFIDKINLSNYGDLTYKENEVIKEAKRWLDSYFEKKDKKIDFNLLIEGSSFQKKIYEIVLTIPKGKTLTYKDVAEIYSKNNLNKKTSYQGIGKALSKNKLLIFIPCHRVVGKKGLLGYAGGKDRKKELLNLEGINL